MSGRIRSLASLTLARTGALRGWRRVTRGRLRRLLLLGHHRVMPLSNETAFRGDLELVSATPDEFAWQVAYIARHFEPVSCRQIAASLNGGPSLPNDAVAITFDDGFSDLREYAAPILRAAKVPATVFVPTDFVDSQQPFWFDHVAQIFRLAPVRSIHIAPMSEPLPASEDPAARADAAYKVLKLLKYCPDDERVAFLARLQLEHAELAAAAREGLGRALDWNEMRELAAGGIEMGAHSASHPSLASVSPEKLRRELVEPRQKLEAGLGMPCVSFAYPFGGPRSFTPAVELAVQQAGYQVGVTYMTGTNTSSPERRFALRRQHVERYTSREHFEAIVTLPEYFR
jgi:peptidoglycan/xylan/chitin deacetylase (PgdA/CDA1 family)